jgi:HK97 gp10 family phage protein
MPTERIEGLDDLIKTLKEIPVKLRKRALRNALAAGARIVRDAARLAVPILSKPSKYRTPGTVRDAIKVRTSKRDSKAGDVGVFVNVQPAKTAARGAKSAKDPFYWRWPEFGWNPAGGDRSRAGKKRRRDLNRTTDHKAIPGAKFLQRAAAQLPAALEKFKQGLGPQLQKLDTNPRDPL